MPKGLWLMTWRCLRMGSFDSGLRPALSGVSALIRHCTIHVLSGLDARKQLWPLRDHWADNSRGRSAPTPSLVCHFVLDAPLSMTWLELCDRYPIDFDETCRTTLPWHTADSAPLTSEENHDRNPEPVHRRRIRRHADHSLPAQQRHDLDRDPLVRGDHPGAARPRSTRDRRQH